MRLLVHTCFNCSIEVSVPCSSHLAVQPWWEYVPVQPWSRSTSCRWAQLSPCCLHCSARKGKGAKCFFWCSPAYPVLRMTGTMFGSKECRSVCQRDPPASTRLLPRLQLPVLPSLLLPLQYAPFHLLYKKSQGAAQPTSHFPSPLRPHLPTDLSACTASTANCGDKLAEGPAEDPIKLLQPWW